MRLPHLTWLGSESPRPAEGLAIYWSGKTGRIFLM